MQQLHLNWTKCQEDVWCKLSSVNLNHSHFNHLEGIYIIWHGGQYPAVVYIGQGNIKDRISHTQEMTRKFRFMQIMTSM